MPPVQKVEAHLARVVAYADSKAGHVGAALDELLGSPGMDDTAFAALELKLSANEQANLKAVIVGTMEDATIGFVNAKVGRRATGLEVARLLLQPVAAQSKARVAEATRAVVQPPVLGQGAELAMALTVWAKNRQYLKEQKQEPSGHQLMAGLERMAGKLGLEHEFLVEEKVASRTGRKWDSEGLLQLLQSKVAEYPEAAKPKAASAKAAVVDGAKVKGKRQSTCHDYLRGRCNRGQNCAWQHPAGLEGRVDLVPVCHEWQEKGLQVGQKCSRKNCSFQHGEGSEVAVAKAARVEHKGEASEALAAVAKDPHRFIYRHTGTGTSPANLTPEPPGS